MLGHFVLLLLYIALFAYSLFLESLLPNIRISLPYCLAFLSFFLCLCIFNWEFLSCCSLFFSYKLLWFSLSIAVFCLFVALCGLQDLSSPTRDQTIPPAVEAPNPNCWATREFLYPLQFKCQWSFLSFLGKTNWLFVDVIGFYIPDDINDI